MDERAVAELHDLAERDAELGSRAEELRRRDSDVGEIRARAEAIDAFFTSYPENDTRVRAALAAAAAELAHRREELAEAEATLARSRDDDARIQAQHAVDRAHDHIAVATASLARTESDLAELEREATALPDELTELERRVDAEVSGTRALINWASHAHAEVFVAQGQLDTQRERVIREAHELASMLLGEPTYGATVAQALARVEARLPHHSATPPGQVSESK